MPTFKHPCPHCGKYIARDIATCPFCGTADPFAPARCLNCRTVIEDRAWLACPKCGQALARPTPSSQPAARAPQPAPEAAQPAPPSAGKCSACGAPLADGARFCTACGTLTA